MSTFQKLMPLPSVERGRGRALEVIVPLVRFVRAIAGISISTLTLNPRQIYVQIRQVSK